MNKTLLKLPGLTILAALSIRIINNLLIAQMIRGTNEWTIEMGDRLILIDAFLSLIAFVIIGLTIRKTLDRKTIFKSATMLVLYAIVLLIFEQATQYYGIFNVPIALILYLPTELFTIISALMANLSRAETLNFLFLIPAILAPYLFVPFGKKETPTT